MDLPLHVGAPVPDLSTLAPAMDISHPAPAPPPRRTSQRLLSIETRRAACTHLTVTRMYDTFGGHRCNLCHRVPWNGYVWWCSQDHGTWLPQYEYANEPNPAWHVSHNPKLGEDVDIAPWMAKAIIEGHYNEDQIHFIKAQRQHVHDTIAYLEDCHSMLGYDGPAFTPPGLAPRRPDLVLTSSAVVSAVANDAASNFSDETALAAANDISALPSVHFSPIAKNENPPTAPDDVIPLISTSSCPNRPLSIIDDHDEQPKVESKSQHSAVEVEDAQLELQAQEQGSEFSSEPQPPRPINTSSEGQNQQRGHPLKPETSSSTAVGVEPGDHQSEFDFGPLPPLPPATSAELQKEVFESPTNRGFPFPIIGGSDSNEHHCELLRPSKFTLPTMLGSELSTQYSKPCFELSDQVPASTDLDNEAISVLRPDPPNQTTATLVSDALGQEDGPLSPPSTPMLKSVEPTSRTSFSQFPADQSTPLPTPPNQTVKEPTPNTGRFSAQFLKPPPMGLGPSMFPICNYRACSSCRYFWKDRAWASIESSIPDTTNLPPPHELANRRISDRNVVARIGLHPSPPTPSHYRSWVELHMGIGWSRHISTSSNVLSRQSSQWAGVDTELDDTESSEVDGKDRTRRGLRASLRKAFRHVLPRRRDSSRSTVDSKHFSRRFRRREEDTEDGDIGLSSTASSEIGLEGRTDLISGSERELEEAALTPLPESDRETDVGSEEFQDGELELDDGVAVTEEGVEFGTADIIMQA